MATAYTKSEIRPLKVLLCVFSSQGTSKILNINERTDALPPGQSIAAYSLVGATITPETAIPDNWVTCLYLPPPSTGMIATSKALLESLNQEKSMQEIVREIFATYVRNSSHPPSQLKQSDIQTYPALVPLFAKKPAEESVDVNLLLRQLASQTTYAKAQPVETTEAFNFLITHGADVNSQGASSGDTALHVACRCANKVMQSLLLKSSANAKITNNAGKTPAQCRPTAEKPATAAVAAPAPAQAVATSPATGGPEPTASP